MCLWLTAVVATSQVHEYPYRSCVERERDVVRFLDAGLVRRAYAEVRTLRETTRTSAATDAVRFRRSDIDRSSGNRSSADRTLESFVRERRNSPDLALAWMERGFLSLEDNDATVAATMFDEAAMAAERDISRRDSETFVALAHRARYWQGVSLATTGAYREASDALYACIRVDSAGPYAPRALYAIGQLHERNEDRAAALAAFAEVRRRFPRGSTVVASRIREAQLRIIERRPERALDALTGIESLITAAEVGDTSSIDQQVDLEESREEVLAIRSEAATLRGRESEALDSCRAFLERYPSSPRRWHVRQHAGYNALAIGRFDEALEHFTIILDSVTDESNSIRQLALLYHPVTLRRMGRKNEALEAFAALALRSDYPYQAQALVETGQAAYESGDFDKGRKALERAERDARDPMTSVRAQVLLGAVYVEQQQWTKAAAAYERAEQRALTADSVMLPGRTRYISEARLKRGICLVQSQQTQAAIAALSDFLGNHPTDPRRDEATFWLAEAMYRADLLKNAQELYSEIVDRFTASRRREEAMYGLAWTYFRRRFFEKSVDAFGDLLRDFPDSKYATEAFTRRGDGYYVSKQFRAAAEQYRQAATRSPNSEEGQYSSFQRGQALYRAGDLDEAISAMRAFVRGYTTSRLADDALYLIGWISFQRRDYATAITELESLLAAYPSGDHVVRALYTIADARYNLGETDAALEQYRVVIHRFPSHPLAAEAARSMQYVLLGMGRSDEAIAIADTLINANPTSLAAEEFSYKKAEIFYSGKNYTTAAAELEAYLKKYPSATRADEALYLLGMTYLNMSDVRQAQASFSDLRKKYPESEFVPTSLLELAGYFERTANATSADSVYDIVMTAYKDDSLRASRAGFERASLARLRGDTVKAISIWTLTADRYGETEYGDQARYQLAMYHRRKGASDSARFHLGILATRMDQPLLAANALYDIGVTFVREKRYDEAVVQFQKVRDEFAGIEDWYTLSLLGLGECLEQLQRPSEAVEVYSLIVDLRPDDDFGNSARSRLKRLQKGGRR